MYIYITIMISNTININITSGCGGGLRFATVGFNLAPRDLGVWA